MDRIYRINRIKKHEHLEMVLIEILLILLILSNFFLLYTP